MISGGEFAAGAQQMAAHWARCLPGEPPWRWQPSRQPFAAAAGGGHLELQRVHQAAPGPACGTHAGPELDSEPLAPGSDGEEEADTADARQCTQCMAAGAGADSLAVPGTSPGAPAQAPLPPPPEQRLLLQLTCHIAYHLSYRVPVLYFELAGRDGAPLGLDAALAALPQLRGATAGSQPDTVVTQEEHPFLHRPFLMLHPCQTEAIMQLLTETGTGAGAGEAAAQGQGCGGAAAAPAAAAGTAAGGTLRYLLAWLSVAGQPLGLRLPPQLWRQALT